MRITRRIADITMLRLAIDLTARYIREYTNAEPYNALLYKVYGGDMKFREGLKLWWIHMRAWLALVTRVGFYGLRNTLIALVVQAWLIWTFKNSSLWPLLHRFLVYWNLSTTYEGIFTSGVRFMGSIVKGSAFTGGLFMIFLAWGVGNLIWAGYDVPDFEASRKRRTGEMRREVVYVSARYMFSKPVFWSPHVRYRLAGTDRDARFHLPSYEVVYGNDRATLIPWVD
jgi:hypothetical protein